MPTGKKSFRSRSVLPSIIISLEQSNTVFCPFMSTHVDSPQISRLQVSKANKLKEKLFSKRHRHAIVTYDTCCGGNCVYISLTKKKCVRA